MFQKDKISDHVINLHNPPFAHHSSVYLTLLSVFQIMTFGEIISAFIDVKHGKLGSYVLEYSLALFFIIVLWHKYADHHQLAGWQLTYWDTLIIATFGLVEGGVIIAFYKEQEFWIHAVTAFSMFLGAIAYWHSLRRLRKLYVQKVYEQHFENQEYGRKIHYILLGFEKTNQILSLKIGTILLIIAIIALITPNLSPYLSILSFSLLVYYLQKWEMRKCFDGTCSKSLEKQGQEIWQAFLSAEK